MAMTAEQRVSAAGLIGRVSERLTRGDLAERRREARLLLALALDRAEPVLPHEDIVFPLEAETKLAAFISRRNEGEPVSRLRGWREFYSLRFYLNNATLDPRADSEVLVDTGLTLPARWTGRSILSISVQVQVACCSPCFTICAMRKGWGLISARCHCCCPQECNSPRTGQPGQLDCL